MVGVMKNPYKRDDHRAAFEQALKLLRAGLDRYEVSKQLPHSIPRYKRQSIAAKAARLVKRG
jgi:hypothetical protein